MNARKKYVAMTRLKRNEQAYATGRGASRAIRTHQEVANILGVSKQAVHQMERVAIHKIRIRMLEILKELNPELHRELNA